MASSDDGVERLYKNFGVLADAGDKISEHSAAYEGIIKAAKGSVSEKKLAASFISRFYRNFPTLHDSGMDAMLDLIEDEDAYIRRSAIKALPDICKGCDDSALCTRVADVLTQLLPAEDANDLALVKMGMSAVLQLNTQAALAGIFGQITGDDETVREKGIEYLSSSVMRMRGKLFTSHIENEKFLVLQVKKVLVDVTGEEFEGFMDLLMQLQYITTAEGVQEVIAAISEQAELSSDFQSDDAEAADRFLTCFRQALKFCKFGYRPSVFLEYVCIQILPKLSSIGEEQTRHELLQVLAEACVQGVDVDSASKCIQPVFTVLVAHMPLPPPEEGEAPKLQFSVVECALSGFHHLVGLVPEFLTAEANAERLKDFRLRLQYFARGCQTYHSQLQAALKGKNALELKEEQNKIRSIALRTTANISALIRDFFHNPPTYKTRVQLSWGAKKLDVSDQRKRTSSQSGATPSSSEGAGPTKRKPSPIRFDLKGGGAGTSSSPTASSSKREALSSSKRDSLSVYEPPRDRFSKNIANGSFGDGKNGRGRGRGRGRGQTWRGKRGSWKDL